MAPNRIVYLLVLILALSLAGCTSSPASVPTPTNTSTTIPTPHITEEPTMPPAPTPTEALTPTPPAPNLYLPNGIATFSQDTGKVAYYDLQGVLLGELQVTNLGTGIYQQAHIAGPLTYSPAPVLPPLVYYAFQNGGELWQNNNDSVSLLRAAPNLFCLIGVPGQSIMAFSTAEGLDIGLRSTLYLGDLLSLPSGGAVLEATNTESYAVKPLAITMTDGQAVGIWYTTVPYGIGGDIVFEPRQNLSYLTVATYQTQSYLDSTKAPVGLSDDQTWIAYTAAGGAAPINIVNSSNPATTVSIPLDTTSDRGAGDAFFSPDNHYIAWKEASGSLANQPPNFHETIRIATLDGTVINSIPDTALVTASGFQQIDWVIPVGWLDPQTLVLEVRNSSTMAASILKVAVETGSASFMVPGSFIGLIYP